MKGPNDRYPRDERGPDALFFRPRLVNSTTASGNDSQNGDWAGESRSLFRDPRRKTRRKRSAMLDFNVVSRTLTMSAALSLLAGCGGSQPMTAAPSGGVQSATRSPQRPSLRGYYLAKLTTVVGNSLPGSSLCFRFKPNGSWSSSGSVSFTGTYLIARNDLFASALWLPSPAFFLSFEGSVNAKQGSGKYTYSGMNGQLYAGGTFTMTAKQSKSCS